MGDTSLFLLLAIIIAVYTSSAIEKKGIEYVLVVIVVLLFIFVLILYLSKINIPPNIMRTIIFVRNPIFWGGGL